MSTVTQPLPQGEPRLLQTPVAQRLLASTELVRLAYVAPDALRRAPEIAVTIDRAGPPPEVLLVRGRASLTEVEGIVPEYAQAQARYYGPEQGIRAVTEIDRPGTRMVRIALRPSWVGTIDFVERFPGGATTEQFAHSGQA